VQPQVANAQIGPVLDEATFQQILQAAYVIQQRNDGQRGVPPKIDPANTLGIIAETQELLHSQLYDVQAAANLIAERLRKITHATGVAVAVVAKDQLTYCAATGSCASLAGSSEPIEAKISELLREQDAGCGSPNGVDDNSPAVFPIFREGQNVGLLQLSFPENQPIQEHEIRSCQLLAGLLGETISRAAELEWKQSLAAERATMLEALEQLRPQLERLAAEPAQASPSEPAAPISTGMVANFAPDGALPVPIGAEPEPTAAAEVPLEIAPGFADFVSGTHSISTCKNCGFHFNDGEMFCGRCGTPRSVEIPPSIELPADADLEQSAKEPEVPHDAVAALADMRLGEALEPATLQFASDIRASEDSTALAIDHQPAELKIAEEEQGKAEMVEEVATPAEPSPDSSAARPSPWSSATSTRRWLHSLQQADQAWLARHSGDISLLIAAIVLLLVLYGWNSHPVLNKVHAGTPAQPSLTLFERMLVALGLAEAPAAPVYTGNPNVQVWEDLHTGLYYCGGADLYGKTPGGKVTSQRDAQLDQFEPAARKACE
jgi:uncharacterized Zn finger protein (UPF0148 family)